MDKFMLKEIGIRAEATQNPIRNLLASQPKFRFQYVIECQKWKQTATLECDCKTGSITTVDNKEFLHAVDITIRSLAACFLYLEDEFKATVDVPVDDLEGICGWTNRPGHLIKIQKGEIRVIAVGTYDGRFWFPGVTMDTGVKNEKWK